MFSLNAVLASAMLRVMTPRSCPVITGCSGVPCRNLNVTLLLVVALRDDRQPQRVQRVQQPPLRAFYLEPGGFVGSVGQVGNDLGEPA